MPLSKLHKAAILYHRPAGRGYYRLVLKAPEAAKAARPGQFVMLRVSENLDPLLARPFGVSSVLSNKSSIEIYYRVVGRGTTLLTAREPGHTLMMYGPLGNGFPLPDKGVIPIMVAGGSGFPPLHFLSLKAGSRAQLFVGARNKDCLPPAGVLRSFRDHTKKVYIATEDGSQGEKGMVTELLRAYLDNLGKEHKAEVYACGPRPMLAAVAHLTAERSIPCKVSMEERMACGLGACMSCSIPLKAGGYRRACKEGPVFPAEEIEWGENIRMKFI